MILSAFENQLSSTHHVNKSSRCHSRRLVHSRVVYSRDFSAPFLLQLYETQLFSSVLLCLYVVMFL